MAEPSFGAQAGRAGGDAVHQLIGVQAALHQELAFALADELNRLIRRGVAVRRVDNFEAADVEPVRASDGGNFRNGPHENGDDDAGVRSLDRASQ